MIVLPKIILAYIVLCETENGCMEIATNLNLDVVTCTHLGGDCDVHDISVTDVYWTDFSYAIAGNFI